MPPLLTVAQQDELIDRLYSGGATIKVLRDFGLPIESFDRTLDEDAAFAARYERVQIEFDRMAAAALFKNAMTGSATAQMFWLKNNPPPEWKSAADDDELDDLSTDQLTRLADEDAGRISRAQAAPDPAAAGGEQPAKIPHGHPHQ